MHNIRTPIGTVQVFLDGRPVDGKIYKLNNEGLPKFSARYLMELSVDLDGQEHLISCRFLPSQAVRRYGDGGERCEVEVYHTDDMTQNVLIGVEGEEWGLIFDDPVWFNLKDRYRIYDYDLGYEEDDGLGYLQYCVHSFTKTYTYRFGVLYVEKRSEEDSHFCGYDVDPACIGADDILEEL